MLADLREIMLMIKDISEAVQGQNPLEVMFGGSDRVRLGKEEMPL